MKFNDCYSILNYESHGESGAGVFSKEGDSGAGVFLVGTEETLKPLGILIGGYKISQLSVVCKIDKVLKKLGLNIVQFANERYWLPSIEEASCC